MKKMKQIGIPLIIFLGFLLLRSLGFNEFLRDVRELQDFFINLGLYAYLVFIGLYALASVFLIPGSILTIAGGLVFGPFWGGFLSLLGATLGASLAFVLGRYSLRGFISRKFGHHKTFQALDEGVKENGVSFLILTRLVPLFPFSLQNYAYGLTGISLPVYVITSFICMAPGSFLYAYLAGIIIVEGVSLRLLVYFTLAGVLLFILSYLPRKFFKKKKMI